MTAAEMILLAYARSEAGGDGASVDWDDIDHAFELAKRQLPGRYEELLAEVNRGLTGSKNGRTIRS